MIKLMRIEATLLDHDKFTRDPRLELHIMIGDKGYGYTKYLPTPLTDSYFDLIWEDMGDAFKRAIKEKEKDGTVQS